MQYYKLSTPLLYTYISKDTFLQLTACLSIQLFFSSAHPVIKSNRGVGDNMLFIHAIEKS